MRFKQVKCLTRDVAMSESPISGTVVARRQTIWLIVSRSPLGSLWNLQDVPVTVIASRTWKAILEDRILGRSAELAFYFLFALFPTLFSASSLLGLAAQSASEFYDKILQYLAIVVPTSALGTILETFNETTAAATSGKLTFGLIAAVWSASVGVSAIQDVLNDVYKISVRQSYLQARMIAIGLTIVLSVLFTLILTTMLGGDFFAEIALRRIHPIFPAMVAAILSRVVGWLIATSLLALTFSIVCYFAPNLQKRRWHWFTPGGGIGILGWLTTSLGLRLYLKFFNSYAVTYGSLGAVIILLTWFYVTALMLLIGAEVNSEIEAAVALKRIDQASFE
jgi:membrane protein